MGLVLAFVLWPWVDMGSFRRLVDRPLDSFLGLRADRWLHLGAGSALGLWLGWGARLAGRPWWQGLLVAALGAAADEFAQILTPRRSFSWLDLLWSGYGLTLAALLQGTWLRWRGSRGSASVTGSAEAGPS